jgi:uncharacterized membrane protein
MQPRIVARWALALIYLAAGVLHLAEPTVFLAIMPDWVPFPRKVVLATGVAEIAGAIGLLTGRWDGRWRRAAGIGLALYAVCVVPANIKHAMDGLPAGAIQLGWWYHGPRLALQPVLVWWALYVGDVVDWPKALRFGTARAGKLRHSPALTVEKNSPPPLASLDR